MVCVVKSDSASAAPSPLSDDEHERGVPNEERVITLPLAVFVPPPPPPPRRTLLKKLELPESEREMAMPLAWWEW